MGKELDDRASGEGLRWFAGAGEEQVAVRVDAAGGGVEGFVASREAQAAAGEGVEGLEFTDQGGEALLAENRKHIRELGRDGAQKRVRIAKPLMAIRGSGEMGEEIGGGGPKIGGMRARCPC